MTAVSMRRRETAVTKTLTAAVGALVLSVYVFLIFSMCLS